MSRLGFYHRLTWLDIVRLWSSVQHHVIIVAGICLPILLLLGLRNGHVAGLRKEMEKSPTGREIVIWIARRGELLSHGNLEKYREEIDGIDLAIPSVQRVVKITSSGLNGEPPSCDSVTLFTTSAGDPILGQYGADVLAQSADPERVIVLAKQVADSLHVKVGDPVKVHVSRVAGSVQDSATLDMTVGGVVQSGEQETTNLAYASVDTLMAMERFIMGFQVPKFQWPAINAAAPDTYAGYLVFCKRDDPLHDGDIQSLGERGYDVWPVNDPKLCTLHGLLKPESLDKLRTYYIHGKHSPDAPWGSCADPPREITRLLKPDTVVIPWNAPKEVTINNKRYIAIGLTLQKITWLKQYVISSDASFSYKDETFLAAFPENCFAGQNVNLRVDDQLTVALTAKSYACKSPEVKPKSVKPETPPAKAVTPETLKLESPKPAATTPEVAKPNGSKPASTNPETRKLEPAKSEAPKTEVPKPESSELKVPKPDTGSPKSAQSVTDQQASSPIIAKSDSDRPIIVLPIDLLSFLYAFDAHKVEYDAINKHFVAVPSDPIFAKARVYAKTIDEVPAVVEEFHKRGYAALSEVTRISEIHKQTNSLTMLVYIVGICVFFFGVITVVSVLLDSTERKRSTIGILRVMGVSRAGIFYTVFLRATIIACFAAVITIVVGYAIALFLQWQPRGDVPWASLKPVIQVIIQPRDLLIVAAGALACCGLGSLIPARKAANMDPFDAIVEGRFR